MEDAKNYSPRPTHPTVVCSIVNPSKSGSNNETSDAYELDDAHQSPYECECNMYPVSCRGRPHPGFIVGSYKRGYIIGLLM